MTPEARALAACACALACVLGWFVTQRAWGATPWPMQTKAHILIAVIIGALLPYVPQLVALVPLPPEVANALCAVILAVAAAYVPKDKAAPKPEDKPTAGSSLRSLVFQITGLVILFAVVACAALGKVKEDPGKAAHDVRNAALGACLVCRSPGLPEPAREECAKLEPVCSALAGVCDEPKADSAADAGAPATP